MSQTYWRSATADAAMQGEHAFIWEAMLDTIDVDHAGKRVLDAGCNRGGFLRLLADRCGVSGRAMATTLPRARSGTLGGSQASGG